MLFRSFPGATPGQIKSPDGQLVISGDATIIADDVTADTATITTLDTDSLVLGGSQAMTRIKFGQVSGTTNGTGQLVITHNLGVTPVSTLVTGWTGTVRLQGSNSTTTTVQCTSVTGTVQANTAVTVAYIVIA